MILCIAADPGMEGAVAAIDEQGRIVRYQATPRIGKTGPVDTVACYSFLKDLMKLNPERIFLSVEDVHALYQVSALSTSKLMQSKGEWIALLSVIAFDNENASFEPIPPKEWQKIVWIYPDRVEKAGKVDTKKTSLACARRLWPQEKFLETPKCKVPHDGIIDALLIAEAIRRKLSLR